MTAAREPGDGGTPRPRPTRRHCEAAAKIAAPVEHGRERFDTDEDLQIVLTHLIQIIGEAATRLSAELVSDHPEVPWRALIGMRHRVVHDYFAIDTDILWTAAN